MQERKKPFSSFRFKIYNKMSIWIRSIDHKQMYCEYEAGQEVRFTGLRNKMGLYFPLCRTKRKSHVKRLAKFSLNRSKEINFLA